MSTNAERAARGREIVNAYIAAHGVEDDQTTLADVLADLMHLAWSRRADADCPMNYGSAERSASMHFIAERVPARPVAPKTFEYSHWRHGGWYVHNVRYPSGAIGCVSRNYPDGKWRVVCDPRGFEKQPTFKTRDDAARAEWELANARGES